MKGEEKHYPNEEKLSTYFKEDIEKYLKQHGRSCQSAASCLTLDVDYNYQRNFNLRSVSVSAPTIDRKIVIYKGDTIVYNNTKKRMKLFKGGLLGNALNEVSLFSKAGEEKANLEDERHDIDLISQLTVKDVVALER